MPKTHVVQQGDTLIRIAHQHGFTSWEAIWNDEANSKLREKRPDPMVLYPGDRVTIPDRKLAEHRCRTNKRHSFRLEPPLKARLRLVLEDEGGQALANKRFELEVDGAVVKKGNTTGGGLAEAEVEADARTGKLTLWPEDGDEETRLQWELDLGHLDPVEEDSGIRDRLTNLGYDAGTGEAVDAAKLEAALKAFQRDQGLDQTGRADQQTRDALVAAHLA